MTTETSGAALTDNDVANILAALRYWQEYSSTAERHYDEHMEEGKYRAYSDREIDQLCKRLDFKRQ